MENRFNLPQLATHEPLGSFAFKLRQRVFSSQNQAAQHFALTRGTVSRYENDSQDSIVPPIGYLAGLIRLFVERSAQRATPSEEIASYRDFFLGQLNKLLHNFPVEYNYMEPFRNWEQLCAAADSFMTRHTGFQPKADIGQGVSSKQTNPYELPLPQEPSWPINIPNDSYYVLPGREVSIDSLLEGLIDNSAKSITVIDGLGGLGKTAFAVELCRRAVSHGAYTGIVGDSARLQVFTGWEIVPVRDASLDLNGLLDTLAGQFGLWELVTASTAEKVAHIAQVLRHRPYIVLVDNMETVDNANALVLWLRQILRGGSTNKSKAVITSRMKVVNDDAHTHTLHGLNADDAAIFLRAEAKQRVVPAILNANQDLLARLCRVTGGAPLALKLIVAQARFFDLDVVLNAVEQAGTDLYRFLYEQIWLQLSADARQVLMYVGHTVVTNVGWYELLESSVVADKGALLSATGQLVNSSLLEVSSVGETFRYSIHQLTRQFVLADLPGI